MSLQNRVTPFGALIASPARGALMGNRGCLHDHQQRIRRPFQVKRWIICLLEFKNRRRPIMAPGRYTELFFLDEATALAAGHRPCAECQRQRFNRFRQAWIEANPEQVSSAPPTAVMLDEVLHRERLTAAGQKRVYPAPFERLPDGTLVTLDSDDSAFLVVQGRLLRWTPFGYTTPVALSPATIVNVLTPRSVVGALAAGYPVSLHASACVCKENIR